MKKQSWRTLSVLALLLAHSAIETNDLNAQAASPQEIILEMEENEKIRIASLLPALPEPNERYNERKERHTRAIKQANEDAQKKQLELIEQRKHEWQEAFPIVEGDSKEPHFLNHIAKDSVDIARKANLYPSVLMAQAGLESAWGKSQLASEHNNLFGIKGKFEGASATFETWEDMNQEIIYIHAGFRSYPSVRDSITDYALLLRNGLRWNDSFYSGTWRENAKVPQEATAYLQGRYATDTLYASKLNAIIERYDLTRFDEVPELDLEVEVSVEMPKAFNLNEGEYLVREGDTIQLLLIKHGIALEDFLRQNELDNYRMHVNQVLSIDSPKKVGESNGQSSAPSLFRRSNQPYRISTLSSQRRER